MNAKMKNSGDGPIHVRVSYSRPPLSLSNHSYTINSNVYDQFDNHLWCGKQLFYEKVSKKIEGGGE